MIFLCGHGALGTDGVYAFATHETEFVGNKIQAGTGLTAPNLIALLRSIKAQKLLFIINACFSGQLSPTLGPTEVFGAPSSASFGLDVLASGEGRALITASRPTQYSYYMPDAEHTFFGQALLDGLYGKAGVTTFFRGKSPLRKTANLRHWNGCTTRFLLVPSRVFRWRRCAASENRHPRIVTMLRTRSLLHRRVAHLTHLPLPYATGGAGPDASPSKQSP